MNTWHHYAMAKRSGQKRDFMQVARGIVEQAIGEQMDGKPLPTPEPATVLIVPSITCKFVG